MKKLSFYCCLLYILCACNGNGGDLMKLVAERDSLKAKTEKQEIELKNNNAAIQAINSAIDSIAVQEGLIFTSSSNETPITKADALKNIERFQSVIDQQRQKIAALQAQLAENPNDAAVIKANIAEMVSNYAWILKLNHRNLFYVLREKSALAIMCLLMNEKSRNYYLPVVITAEDGTTSFDTEKNADKSAMFGSICQMINQSDIATLLEGNLMTFAGMTDGYWKDLEPKGKKYMIISMGDGDYVRSAGHSGGDLSSADILNKFVIVDGVDYKSNSDTRKLLYMEV